MLLRFTNLVSLSLILGVANAHGHDHIHNDHDHDHHGHSHSHANLRRNLGVFDNSNASSKCKSGAETYTVGGVTYECEEAFQAAGGNCRTLERTREEKAQAKADFDAWLEAKKNGNNGNNNNSGGGRRLAQGCGDCVDWDTVDTIVIPTVMHVIHDGATGRKYTYSGYPESNPKYIQDQIKALNIGFSGAESMYEVNSVRNYERYINADTKLRFCLLDTTSSDNANWYSDRRRAENEYKAALDVGGMETLNVFVNTAGGYLGYAYFPQNRDFVQDGVVLLNDSMPGGDISNYNEGDTLTHEVGHWLGLDHTHYSGCSGPGDYMDDAPASGDYDSITSNESTATYGCPANLDNCSGDGQGKVNPIHNFMSYVVDDCMDQFSPGQVPNVQQAWEVYRHKEGYSELVALADDGFSCDMSAIPSPSPTATPPQPPTDCADRRASCTVDSDCCSNNCKTDRKGNRKCA